MSVRSLELLRGGKRSSAQFYAGGHRTDQQKGANSYYKVESDVKVLVPLRSLNLEACRFTTLVRL